MTWAMSADSGSPRVRAGMTRLARPSSPSAGSQPRPKLNTCTSRSPVQKVGKAAPRAGIADAVARTQRRRVPAAIRAVAGPATTATSSAAQASRSVVGSRSRIASVTGCPVWTEVPRSPVTAAASWDRYWTGRGRSSPCSARSACRSASEIAPASRPPAAMAVTGSPGITYRIRKAAV